MALMSVFRKTSRLPLRFLYSPISTSSKKKETLTFPDEVFPKKTPPGPKTAEEFADVKNQKNWVSYGFDDESYEADRHDLKVTFFSVITVLLVGGAFLISYAPDPRLMDWALREAFLQIHEREKQGLPVISKDYIDPEKVVLPTDEELGDTEIII